MGHGIGDITMMMEDWCQYQQKMLKMWTDAYPEQSQEWMQWLPTLLMGEHSHGLSMDQRSIVDELAQKHSDMLQQMLTLSLQHLSFNAELSERCMELVNKFMGLKT